MRQNPNRKQNSPKKQWVFGFLGGLSRLPGGDGESRVHLLGGKGAHLMEMCKLNLPVPPGLVISTEACISYYENQKKLPQNLTAQVAQALAGVEKATGKKFGDAGNPLLVSVRSGARVSMPGMMDTVLNLGLNDQTIFGLIKASHNERFAYDCYRRFIQMYSSVVLGIDHHEFEQILDHHKLSANAARDTDLTAAHLKAVILDYKKVVKQKSGREFPQSAQDQLWGAVKAVFDSWHNNRAKTYRKIHGIPEEWGTAVTVQAMVFGNLGDDCATGVAFTRNPSTGEKLLYGEYLINAQGEDVVAGIRTPQPILKSGSGGAGHTSSAANQDHPLAKSKKTLQAKGFSMQESMPKVFAELQRLQQKLERHYRDMQDIEFTIERGKLYLLQTRSGKRTAAASIKIAVDMVKEKLISQKEAVLRVDPQSLDQLLHPRLDPDAKKELVGRGLPASPGAASGILVFSADEAEDLTHRGQDVILARQETSPEDIHGMHSAKGIITTRGGMTSHAAVVARGMGKPCIVGASSLKIDYASATLSGNGVILRKGDVITMDGASGEVMRGSIPMLRPEMTADFATLMRWADGARYMKIRANADTPEDARAARKFGAEGIGLCRTEHMFFDTSRIAAMREMILAEGPEQRKKALAKLLPLQKSDFEGIAKEMQGLPITIRLLDPPLHEFLPHADAEIEDVARSSGIPAHLLRERVHNLREINPMLGLRGCRLGIVYPEIYAMQVRAILEAGIEVKKKTGKSPQFEIMVPLISGEQEFSFLKRMILQTADAVFKEKNTKIPYIIGTMIELPRAALRAGQIALEGCEFFSFGTNDLTQTAMGLSRDDAGSFLPEYEKYRLFAKDPFVSLDQEGVGELVQVAVDRGRRASADLKIGICGEHGGEPQSVEFFHRSGLDYVSCSPYRVPIARLAAAHAAIRHKSIRATKTKPKARIKSRAGNVRVMKKKTGAKKQPSLRRAA